MPGLMAASVCRSSLVLVFDTLTSRLGAYIPHGHGLAVAQRIPNGYNALSHLQFIGVAQPGHLNLALGIVLNLLQGRLL